MDQWHVTWPHKPETEVRFLLPLLVENFGREIVSSQLRDLWEALDKESIEHGDLGYLDPVSKLFVANSQFLKDQGFCCQNECRHCPYND